MLFTLIKISSLSTQLTILAPEIYNQADRNRLGKGAWEKTKKNPSMMDFALHIHTYIKIHHFSVFFPSDSRKLSIKTTEEKKKRKKTSMMDFALHIHTYIKNP